MNKVTTVFPKPKLLLNEEIKDIDLLIDQVKNKTYSSVDTEVPCSRFRGTVVKKTSNNIEVVGWQRNISRLQKADVSLPTIIIIKLDLDYVIKDIYLDHDFDGSKGLLCYQGYLDKNLKEKLINQKVNDSFFKLVQIDMLHCFHLSEVLAGILSSLEIFQQKELDYFFEEEVFDTYVRDEDFIIVGAQKMNIKDSPVNYSMELKRAMELIGFNDNGRIYSTEPLDVIFSLEGKEIFNKKISGKKPKRMCLNMKKLAIEGLDYVKSSLVPDSNTAYMCSNLFFQAFIGLLVQVIVMKKFYNNYNYVLHVLTGIQRSNNSPRCIGAVESQGEADKYFPGFNLSEIF